LNLLLTGAFQYTAEQICALNRIDADVFFMQDEKADIKALNIDIDISEIDAVVCNGLFLSNDISEFKKLKFIQLTSAGFDRIDLNYCESRNIKVRSAKNVYNIPMAEWAVLQILTIYKKSRFFMRNQKDKLWLKNRDLPELYGKTATVVGFGGVGLETAKRLKAFGVRINAVDIYEARTDYNDRGYLPGEIEIPLAESDIVVLAVPLTERTYHMFSDRLFGVMKEGAVIINISRGAIIDEESLIRNIDKFRGVALDVFEEEPLDGKSPLWDIENVIITPHNSFASDQNSVRLFELILENLKNEVDI
jgi:phosphoglycerate dehydrogenase-like enzyme